MATQRAHRLVAVFLTALLALSPAARAALPDYKLGEVAAEDIVTPVPLLVVNPEATDALKQKVAAQVQFIVRQTPQSMNEAETELRASITAARTNFLATLQRALNDRAPGEADLNTPLYARAILEVARVSPKDLPLDQLAPLWVRGASDAVLVETLLQPLREVMALPIVNTKNDTSFPANQMVRLVTVKNGNEASGVADFDGVGPSISAGKVMSLWRARRLVETHFPPGQEGMGRFAGSFVRTNASPDAALTDILRAKRMEGVTVNDTYEAAQVIVHKGQIIDRKALSALAMLREKSLIGTLQTKLDQQQSVAGQIKVQTWWIVAGLGAVGVSLVLVLWRLRAGSGTALVTVSADPALAAGPATKALPGGGDEMWRSRALVAEGKAERAHEAIRTGVLGWMREKIFRTLFRQRAELLSVQQKAETEMRELEQRLEQLHTPLQERIIAYEKRIEELEKDLAVKGEENRKLIGARLSVAKQQLIVAREQGRFGEN